MRRHSGARAVADRERYGTHASGGVATRKDAPHGGLPRLVGPEEEAEQTVVERVAERLGQRNGRPGAGARKSRPRCLRIRSMLGCSSTSPQRR